VKDARLPESKAHMKRRTGPIQATVIRLLVASPFVTFALFTATSFFLHGEPFGSKIVEDRYFVSNHGVFTEVSRNAFLFSLWLGRVVFASFIVLAVVPLGSAACSYLLIVWRWLWPDRE
jgi:hypothetical protein